VDAKSRIPAENAKVLAQLGRALMMVPRGRTLLIGISACLSGEAVRYDAGHKRQPLILSTIGPHAELRPFCPEMAAGLGVPRPPVQLIETDGGRIHARGVEDLQLDVTTALETAARGFCADNLENLSGFILKSRSPSCGLASTPVHGQSGAPLHLGSGVFAARLRSSAPWLPMVEETALNNPHRCVRFLSACAMVARYRHKMDDYAHLQEVLIAALGTKTITTIVDRLLATMADNEKTALDERLSRYWSRREKRKT
jgi:uncharacterized protein YbbK (DUF523 family)